MWGCIKFPKDVVDRTSFRICHACYVAYPSDSRFNSPKDVRLRVIVRKDQGSHSYKTSWQKHIQDRPKRWTWFRDIRTSTRREISR